MRLPVAVAAMGGACDAATGLLLVGRPDLVLRLLGVSEPQPSASLRLVGVFVGVVGMTLLGAVRSGPERLLHALAITAGFRLAVATFFTVAVAGSALEPAWLLVAAFDAAVGIVQLRLTREGLRRG